ncbi:MAG: ribosome silencing factor [Planctomycetota bacterium]
MTEAAAQTEEVDGRAIAEQIARFLDSKRAEEIVILDVQQLIQISGYFVIATGTSQRGLNTLGDGVAEILKKSGLPRLSTAGAREGRWICLDYGEVVVHLFDRDTRLFYELDELWGDAPRLDFERAPAPEADAEV